MTGRLVDMALTLGGKQRVTLEINGDFREIWDKLHQEPVLDVEIKKHREKRSLSGGGYSRGRGLCAAYGLRLRLYRGMVETMRAEERRVQGIRE